MLSNEEKIKTIIQYFSWLESIIKINNDFAYTDINISIENFVLKLLEIMGIGNYENCNLKKINYPYIDLIDEKNKIGIQITSETNSRKIKETLNFNSTIKLKFFLLDSSYKPRIKTFSQYQNFSIDGDIINFEKIIKLLKNQEEKIDDVLNFLKSSIILPVKLDDLRKLFGGYSKYQQETILRDIENTCKKFVPTSITAKCIKHLEDKNLLILVGNPGVGKSYNSKFLVAKYLEIGYKLLYSPNKNLKDILQEYNDEEKFILFIDDIFGSNNIDFMSTISESEIVSLLENTNRNLKIIINSRISFFNDVNQKYDKIGRLGLKPFVIETSQFTYAEKARILIKHLKLSDIPQKCIYNLFEKGNFYIEKITNSLNIYRIIYHKNYNPRLVELMTRLDIINFDDNYIDKFIENLENPYLIYDHSYNNNLENNERLIIKAIYLKSVYRNNYEVKVDSLYRIISQFNITEEEFKISLKKLEKSFVSIYASGNNFICKFYDPSIMDYCINKFKESNDMIIFIDKVENKEELDNILLNDKIDIKKRKQKVIELEYTNFEILKKMDASILKDDEFATYIKDKIFSEKNSFSYNEDCFLREDFIAENEILERLSFTSNIGKYISFSIDGFNNNITKIIIKNFSRFSIKLQNQIIKCSINEIDDLIDSEIRDYIFSQDSKEACAEEILYSEYNDIKVLIIKNLESDGMSINLLNEIEINLKSFNMVEFEDYIDDAFNEDNYINPNVDNDTLETINIVENFYKSII